MEIKIERSTNLKAKPTSKDGLGFGKIFTDHMFVMEYDEGMGWHDARVEPYHPFMIDPACTVLHYAQEIFEGMKAYRTKIMKFYSLDQIVMLNVFRIQPIDYAYQRLK